MVHELRNLQLCIHVYQLNDELPLEQTNDEADGDSKGARDESEKSTLALCQEWILPSRSFVGLWER